jgi:uncharacterized membrane protein
MSNPRTTSANPPDRASGALVRAAVVLGVGLGGFFDGIVFHQLLQWHHMVSTPLPPESVANLRLNTLLDGAFHATTWVITVVGVWLLLRSGGERRLAGAGRVLAGGILAGWGGFNLVEGIVDHHLLGIHHVRPGPDAALYDAAFLMWGAAFVAIGWWLVRSAAGSAAVEVQASGRRARG